MAALLWIAAFLVAAVLYDILQKKHAVIRNFPIIGHFRYWLEAVGPELRQYIVTSNDEERPFSRDERRWIYSTAKRQNSYFGFGTDNHIDTASNYILIKHASFPASPPPEGDPPDYPLPCSKELGGYRGRKMRFVPPSIVNISALSFGSLSRNAVEALNRGAKLANCLQNTGEGGISDYHLLGGELVWQIGTGYFGCRDAAGQFDFERFRDKVAECPVRAVEIKLSQGAKPGLGGVLPAAKVTPEIARFRGVPAGRDCVSPNRHSAFSDADSLLDFVELLAAETGVPIGIKSAVGEIGFWEDLARLTERTGRSLDFVTIDGGEGGTGAAPLTFSDHVALPFRLGFPRVYREFAKRDLHRDIVFIGSARLGLPENALLAIAMGCDMVNVGREAMMAVGCIQAQRCHTGRCPTGVATQNKWLMRGLDPESKSVRAADYIIAMRKELTLLSRACGTDHPSMVSPDHIELMTDGFAAQPMRKMLGYDEDWGTHQGGGRGASGHG
ncbi:MAG: FMN-binding glutamate synthase family protein [Bryobacterales bacterium]|nr:FMN-binding glutamate synthase family protein [Bryobacterales bacterium]MDE0625056.1 FMN-binding glutamate synthase family protein [Bryobacterales bacterium]